MPKSQTPDQSNPDFALILQDKSLSQLSKIDGQEFIKNFNPDLSVSVIKSGGVTIELRLASIMPFTVSTQKLLDFCLSIFTEQNTYGMDGPNPVVIFSIDDYLAASGIPISKPNRDRLRTKLRTDCEVLYGLSLESTDKGDPDYTDKARILDRYTISNSNVRITFNPEFANALIKSYLISLPVKLFTLSDRDKASYYIGKKLAEHYSFKANKSRGTNDIISVKTLLASCPSIPEKEEITNHRYKEKIQVPLTRALDVLAERGVITYEFCNAKKLPLTEKQQTSFTFSTFMNSYIHFSFSDDIQTV